MSPVDRDLSDISPRARTVAGLGHGRDLAVVFLHGEHDYGSRTMLDRELAPLGGTVVVDLSWCAFLDSSIIAIILAKNAKLERVGDHLEVIIPPAHEHLASLFELLGLRALVRVRERFVFP